MKITGKVLLLFLVIAVLMFIVTSCITKVRVNQAPSAVTNIFPSSLIRQR